MPSLPSLSHITRIVCLLAFLMHVARVRSVLAELFVETCKVSLWMKSYGVTIQLKPIFSSA